MNKIQNITRYIGRPSVWIPVVIFGVFYTIHFWFTLLHSNVLYGGPGDHTAGIIWLFDRYPNSPWWQRTSQSAYPWGDQLWSPLFILGQIGYIAFWICAKITGGSIAGYNLFTFIAFGLSFGLSYIFIYVRFIKKPIVTSLLALAITFTPMAFYLDGVGHTSYLFMPAYFVSTIWLLLNLLEKKHAIFSALSFGLLIGSTFLFDPYFILFIPLAAGLFTLSLVAMKYNQSFGVSLKAVAARFGLALASSLIVIIPALVYLRKKSQEVQAITGNTRGDILHDAYIYSAQVVDYLLPPIANPFTPPFVAELKKTTLHGNDPTFTIFIGWTLIIAVVVVISWWIRHRPEAKATKRLRMLGIGFLAIATGAFIFSLPPTIHILSVEIHTPTYVLAKLTPTWRVFARLYFIIQPALLLLVVAGVSEYILTESNRRARRMKYAWLIVSAAVCVLLIEYLPRNPFDVSKFWSFNTSLPSVYQEFKNSPAKVLAEYPMREQPYYRGSLYLSGQHVHNKATINSYSPTSPTAYVRMGVMDLSNPQTIPVLRYLGADTLLVWNAKDKNWIPHQGLAVELKQSEVYSSQFGKNETLRLYSIQPDGPTRRYAATIQNNYRPLDENKLYDIKIPLQSGVSIAAVDLCKETGKSVCESDLTTHYFAAEFENITSTPIDIKLNAAEGSDMQIHHLNPGKNILKIPMQANRYIAQFDPAYDSKILISHQEIVK